MSWRETETGKRNELKIDIQYVTSLEINPCPIRKLFCGCLPACLPACLLACLLLLLLMMFRDSAVGDFAENFCQIKMVQLSHFCVRFASPTTATAAAILSLTFQQSLSLYTFQVF